MAGSDFTVLNKAIADLTVQVAATEGTEASAVTLINGFSAQVTKAVTDALTADDAADAGSIATAQAAVATVTARFNASAAALGTAVVGTPVLLQSPTQP